MDDSGKYQQYYPVLQKEEAEQAETRSFWNVYMMAALE